MKRYLIQLVLLLVTGAASSQSTQAQNNATQEKPKMKFMGAYDGGQPGVSIYKLFDPTEDAVCYVLTPDIAGRKQNENGVWIYEGNSAGSISCFKVKVLVVPVPQQAQVVAPDPSSRGGGDPKSSNVKIKKDGIVE